MALTEEQYQEIERLYGGWSRSLRAEGNPNGLPMQFFRVENINLPNYVFGPDLTISVVQYQSKIVEAFNTSTHSPEPRDAINEAVWLTLIRDELQIDIDSGTVERVKPKDWGYDSETAEFKLKKSVLAVDVAKRYEAWGHRMYAMFEAQNLEHAEFFKRSVYLSKTSAMLVTADICLCTPDFKSLSAEQRDFWAKLMLQTTDMMVEFGKDEPKLAKSAMEHYRPRAYKNIRESGFPELVKLLPTEDVAPSYITRATSSLSSIATFGLGFLPSFRAQQKAAPTQAETQTLLNTNSLAVKTEALREESENELQQTPVDKPIKAANVIISTINKLTVYINANKIDAANNVAVSSFLATSFDDVLGFISEASKSTNIKVLKNGKNACDSFRECYIKSETLLRHIEANDVILQRINDLHEIFAAAITAKPIVKPR